MASIQSNYLHYKSYNNLREHKNNIYNRNFKRTWKGGGPIISQQGMECHCYHARYQ
ncbi:hypothetical protein D3C87_160780 [compost metagenome]